MTVTAKSNPAKRKPCLADSFANNFTPALKWVLCRARQISTMRKDDYIRIAHLEQALSELRDKK